MTDKFRIPDISLICGLIALIVFGHVSLLQKNAAHAGNQANLKLQGAGFSCYSYSVQVNEQSMALEYNARRKLYELGAAQASYSSYVTNGKYAWLQELVTTGYLRPNDSGATLIPRYSITCYLTSGRRGFTLVAEPQDFDLRSFMLTENQQVVLLTPTVEGDPNEDWESVRRMETEFAYEKGYYDYLDALQLLSYDPPLQVRINRERDRYVIHRLREHPEAGYVVDDSLMYSLVFASYMIGDTREFEYELYPGTEEIEEFDSGDGSLE